jgi:hypothetical protein
MVEAAEAIGDRVCFAAALAGGSNGVPDDRKAVLARSIKVTTNKY